MQANLLNAIKNLIDSEISELISFSSSSNRMNTMGETLELYIKDLFCNTMSVEDHTEKLEIFSKHFSYLGNQNNPPDIMIRGGDAIEVKKIEGQNASIALNSSYPKDKLYADSPMITADCRTCEDWKEKDLLYVIGVVKEEKLISLWFVYGDCYAASKETYERIRDTVSSGLRELSGVELAETNELGRVNKVDPLGITYLRIRGMWAIENPNKVFEYVTKQDQNVFTMNALMLKTKYETFPEESRNALESIDLPEFAINDVNIQSPNNRAELMEAKLITFKKTL